MVPNAPPDTVLDVKKSSYKKLSKFLEEKERNGVLHIKELHKGVESITGSVSDPNFARIRIDMVNLDLDPDPKGENGMHYMKFLLVVLHLGR